ncbi:DUF3618 domain-containing protein [Actinocorallia longicatena]|uniref:DUF3618 domain-containing protein n=1 Tax=Actinocorallia longicatena TaxID=111803 RepID=A0ABP6QUB1_9ACTN
MGDRDPDEVEQEIERTREELARTIDALHDRVSPSNVVHRTGDRVREEINKVAVTLGSIIAPGKDGESPLTDEQRKRALVIGGVLLGGTVLLMIGSRRRKRRTAKELVLAWGPQD